MARDFYLVQRMKRSWRADRPEGSPTHALDNLSNVFGYGHMGDYDLDYMGSAEFEWGAIPEAYDRFVKAGKGLTLTEWTYNGHVLDFLYIEKDGEPFDAWADWAEGRSAPDEYSGKVYEQPRFDGKERPYELEERIDGATAPRFGDDWRTHVWWALNGNVMWAFHEDGHLTQMLESMGRPKAVALRG
ncbi:MAG TPA: hypothetical protein VK631_00135 [Solirubrobacteraceae bacterium]|nr:hypothetical protein [Solirubrobacteraceae bacterium]